MGRRHRVVWRLPHRRLGIHHVQHPLPGGQPPLEEVGDEPERDHRPAQHHEIGVEGDELPHGDPPLDDMPGAQPQHQQTGKPENERQSRIEERLQPDEHGVALQILQVLAAEPLRLHRLTAIGPHHTDTGKRFLDHRAQGRQLGLDPLRLAVDRAAEGLDRHRDERQRQQRDQGQHRVDRQHQRDRHDEHHGGAGHVHHGGPDHHPHRVQVVGGAGHQVAGAVGVEIGQW